MMRHGHVWHGGIGIGVVNTQLIYFIYLNQIVRSE